MSTKKKILWQELRRVEFAAAVEADAVVIIPVGAIEQHGDHLPVNVDTFDCVSIAERAAWSIDDFPVLVTPPIWSGFSLMHMAYPGAISLKWHTLINVLTELAICVHTHGFTKIVFLNGHGSNQPIVDGMRMKLAAEDHIPSVMGFSWWDIPAVAEEMHRLTDADQGCVAHAGEVETSIQLYLQPHLVDKDAAVWRRGVWGDPARATREKGERLVKVAVASLAQLLRDYHSGVLDPIVGRETLVGRKDIYPGESNFLRPFDIPTDTPDLTTTELTT
jgi:creatinine amidohydrolase